MKKMKEMLTKVFLIMCNFSMMFTSKIYAAAGTGGGTSASSAWASSTSQGDTNTQSIISTASKFIKPFAIILVFASVVMVGFEIIMKRNKADDRMESMSSLMWVGIGTLVLAFAVLGLDFIMGVVDSK